MPNQPGTDDVNTPERAFAAAVAMHTAGKLQEAEHAYRDLLNQVPNYGPALCNLGVLLTKSARDDEAEQCYQLAIATNPDFADAWFNLGNLHRKRQQEPAAQQAYLQCIKLNPQHVSALFNYAVSTAAMGELSRAADAYGQVEQLETKVGEATLRRGDLLLRLGQAEEALQCFRKYSSANPNEHRGQYNLALALAQQQKPDEALALLQRLLKQQPHYAEAHNALGLTLELLGRKDDAAFHFEQAVQCKPSLADAWSNLGVNLGEQGRTQEAIGALQNSLHYRPNVAAISSNLLLFLNYSSAYTPQQVFEQHLAWGDRFAMPLEPRPTPHQPHDPTRRLRIGYVSADYRDHTLAGFIGLLLKHHDRQQVEVFAYANVTRPDERTAELKALADHWRPIVGLMDRTIAEMIEADKIDVLIDLGGHTASNRLITFAYRPAALQATLFGYPNTTAVRAIDYRITDAISDPPGATEQLSTEQLLRLPRVAWCYSPPVGLPEPGPLPASQSRFFTFGCLNNSAKISDACLQLWATLLQSVPGTRLILMAGASQAGQRRLMDRFVRAGILRDRVVLLGRMPRDQYFAAYNDIDVALDPFPYNGGVTTCDALWMGVPVLSLAGTSYVARQGAMQLITLGLGAMLAADADGFLTLARGLTKRREELAGLRSRLRGILAQSPLCDATGYVRDLEATLRTAWQNTLPKSL